MKVAPAQVQLPGAVDGTYKEVPTMMHTTDAGAPWHETIAGYRERGGGPVDHPAADHLVEVVGRMRWVDGERELTLARERLEHPGADDGSAGGVDRPVDRRAVE